MAAAVNNNIGSFPAEYLTFDMPASKLQISQDVSKVSSSQKRRTMQNYSKITFYPITTSTVQQINL
jgi:hypothetical protein